MLVSVHGSFCSDTMHEALLLLQAWQGGVRKRVKKAQQLGRHPRAAKLNKAATASKQQQESDSQFKAVLAQLAETQALPAEQQATGTLNTGVETDQRLLSPALDIQQSVKMPEPADATHSRSTPAGWWSLDLRNIAMD